MNKLLVMLNWRSSSMYFFKVLSAAKSFIDKAYYDAQVAAWLNLD
jgi:hypothetical protein